MLRSLVESLHHPSRAQATLVCFHQEHDADSRSTRFDRRKVPRMPYCNQKSHNLWMKATFVGLPSGPPRKRRRSSVQAPWDSFASKPRDFTTMLGRRMACLIARWCRPLRGSNQRRCASSKDCMSASFPALVTIPCTQETVERLRFASLHIFSSTMLSLRLVL